MVQKQSVYTRKSDNTMSKMQKNKCLIKGIAYLINHVLMTTWCHKKEKIQI